MQWMTFLKGEGVETGSYLVPVVCLNKDYTFKFRSWLLTLFAYLRKRLKGVPQESREKWGKERTYEELKTDAACWQ